MAEMNTAKMKPFATNARCRRELRTGAASSGAQPVTSARQAPWKPTAAGSIADNMRASSGSGRYSTRPK